MSSFSFCASSILEWNLLLLILYANLPLSLPLSLYFLFPDWISIMLDLGVCFLTICYDIFCVCFSLSIQESKMGSQLKATINETVEAFLFLDKNGDGKLNKKDMVKGLNEASPWEKSPAHITRTRFSTTYSVLKPLLFLLIYVLIFVLFLATSVDTRRRDGQRRGWGDRLPRVHRRFHQLGWGRRRRWRRQHFHPRERRLNVLRPDAKRFVSIEDIVCILHNRHCFIYSGLKWVLCLRVYVCFNFL